MLAASVRLSPLLFWHDTVYFPREYYCQILFTNARAMLYTSSISYILPLAGLLFIHIRISRFLRQQSSNLAIAIKQQRDLAVIRRIFISIGVLLSSVLSSGTEHPLGQRITYITLEISLAIVEGCPRTEK